MDEYSQGVCHDGAAILCNGVMLTVDEIVERLNRLAALEAEKAEREAQEPVAWAWNDALGCMIQRQRDRIAALEAALINANSKPWLSDAHALFNAATIPAGHISERLAKLRTRIAALEAEKADRERQEPVAWAWDDSLGCMHVHCGSRRPHWVDGECSDAKRAETSLRPLYAAPPIPRVEQEPVAWVLFDDIFIAPKDMQDDPPNLECMKPLYAHPLALREPTDDECRRIANEFLILGGPEELAGRVMFNAVREVMTK